MDLRDRPTSSGIAEGDEYRQSRQQGQVVLQGLTEAEPRVQDDALMGDASDLQASARSSRKLFDLPGHVLVSGILLHGAGLTQHVHEAYGDSDAATASRAPGWRNP